MNRVITRHLFLLRHAKSSWDDPAVVDHDRPLNARGRRAAQGLAEHFLRASIRPELVLCSSATRAMETLETISAVMSLEARTRIEPRLYGATAEGVLALVRAVDDGVGSLLVVGHNPGLEDLVLKLMGEDPQVALPPWEKFPTGALAEIVSDCEGWSDLDAGAARLASMTVPRDLP